MLEPILKRRWSILLSVLVFTYIFDSLAPSTLAFEILSRLIYVFVFAGATLAACLPTHASRFALAAVFTWPLISLLSLLLKTNILAIINVTYTFFILTGALIITFYDLSKDKHTKADTMYGSMFGYLLIAFAFALFFLQLEAVQPGSFNFAKTSVNESALVYFSLVTITTLGYGDITPVSQVARVAAGLEAACGVMYVAIFIGKIISRR